MSQINEGIKLLILLRKIDPEMYKITASEVELEMWNRISPHALIAPPDKSVTRAETLARGKKSIAIALQFFANMTEHGLMDKTNIISTFNGAAAATQAELIRATTANGAPDAVIAELNQWFATYTEVINESFAELLYPRPKLEPEVNASSAA